MTDDSESVDILPLLDELRVIGQNGLMDAESSYDQERNERLLELASEYYGKAADLPPETVRERLAGEVGYATAKAGAGATVFNDDREVLLVKRADNGKWGFPAGAIEPNESAADAAIRETKEETGVEVRIVELQGVYHHGTDVPSAHTVTHVQYRCERTGGTLRPSHETEDVRYWPIEDVPVWHPDGARKMAVTALKQRSEDNG